MEFMFYWCYLYLNTAGVQHNVYIILHSYRLTAT